MRRAGGAASTHVGAAGCGILVLASAHCPCLRRCALVASAQSAPPGPLALPAPLQRGPSAQVAAMEHVAGVRVGLAAAGPLSWTCDDSRLLVQGCVLSAHLLAGLLDADFLSHLEEALGTAKPEVGAQRAECCAARGA